MVASRSSNVKRAPVRFDMRRDGDPLIFGWGKHLTRVQKAQYKHLATYSFVGVVLLAIIGVLAFGWVRENVIIPTGRSSPSTTSTCRTFADELDVSQTTWDVLENEILEQNSIASQVTAGNANAVNANNILTPEIQSGRSQLFAEFALCAGGGQSDRESVDRQRRKNV